MNNKHHTRDMILKLVQANPQITMQELMEATCIQCSTNIHYHLRKLREAGLVEGLKISEQRVYLKRAIRSREERGDVKLRKMSKAEEQARIEMVVQKAVSGQRLAFSEDATMNVLPSGVKVIVRKPGLWVSNSHQA